MKLGIKTKSGPEVAPALPKERFPSFDIEDEHAEQFMAQHQPQMGQEVHAHVKLRVRDMHASPTHKRIGFDVMEMHPGPKGKPAMNKAMITDLLKRQMMNDHDGDE